MSKKIIGILQVVAAGLCFGFLGIFGKVLFHADHSVGEILAYRFEFATLSLFAYLLLFKGPRFFFISLRSLFVCGLLGVLGYALFASFYFKAIEGVSVALAAMLLFTYPIIIHFLSVLMGFERSSKRNWLNLIMVSLGLFFVLFGEIEIKSWYSVGFGLLAAFSYSVYVLVSNRVQRNIDSLQANFYIMLFACLALLSGNQVPPLGWVLWSLESLAAVLGLALVCTVAAMVLFLSGLQKLSANEAAVASAIEPIAAVVYSFLFLHSPMNWKVLVGALLIVLAIVNSAVERKSDG